MPDLDDTMFNTLADALKKAGVKDPLNKGGFVYLSISFDYSGLHPRDKSKDHTLITEPGLMVHLNRGDVTQNPSASKLLHRAIEYVEKAAKDLQVDMRPEYAWPDGSLYMRVRVATQDDVGLVKLRLQQDFDRVLADTGVKVERTWSQLPDEKDYNGRTPESYFETPESKDATEV